MAKDKKSFVAYSDWNSTFEKLSDEEAGKLAKMMFSFVSDLNPEAPDRMTELLFEPMKNQLKRDLKSYEKTLDENSRKGRLGNLKRWHPELHQKVISGTLQLEEAEEIIANGRCSDNSDTVGSPNIATAINSSPNIADNDNVNDNDIDNDILLEKETKEENIIKENFDSEFFPEETPIQELVKEAKEVLRLQKEEKEKKVAAKKEKTQPPDLDAFMEAGREIYQNELKLDFSLYEFALKAKYNSWIDAGWKDGHKKPIQGWKNKLRNVIPHLKPIYGKSNNNNSNNGYSNRTGNTSMGQGGKVSAATLLAERVHKQTSGNGYGGNFTTET